ncbi:MAG TPA: hypothetical protein VGJ28_17300, partial [Micromonosporaceae bacterium]
MRRFALVASLLLLASTVVTPAPAAAAAPPIVEITQTGTGTSLTAGSLGLSFEASDLALPGFTGGNLAPYLRTLGTSVIRIGGNTVDQTYWTSSGETPPSWPIATITPADLTALKTLATASGWKVILGVNLKHYDPARAADEAAHAVAALGTSLQAIEIGNEPDLYSQYSGNTGQYLTDFQAYVSAITSAAPGVRIEGTDATSPGSSLQSAFVSAQAGLTKPQVTELTSHFYPLVSSTCGGSPTISDMLGTGARNSETSAADTATASAARLGIPAVLDEGNNIVCEGQQGVSDVYAAALWEID